MFRAFYRRRTLVNLRSEEGFTLIELVIAATIILTAVLALAYTATLGFSGIALARQRDGANGLANKMMEQIRGLPFDTIRKGLSTSDVSGDSAIVTCGTVKCYNGISPNETIPTSTYVAGTVITPLVPHVKTVVVGSTTYTAKSYVTYYQNNITQNSTYRAIVVVTWSNPAVKGAQSRVETQSILYSGAGCQSTATPPFAAPCQPFFYGTGTISSGHIDVTGNFPNADFKRATLWLPDVTSSMQIEQVNEVQGNTQASGVSTVNSSGTETFSNRTQVPTAADNDPAQSDPDYVTASLPSLLSKTLTITGDYGSLWVTSTGGDSGTSISTVTANTASHACQSENDNQPCGSDTTFPGQNSVNKTMSANMDLTAGITDLGSTLLASVGGPSAQSIVFTDRNMTPGTSRCLGASGDGCVHVEGTQNLGTVSLAGLPPNLPAGSIPPGWQGYFVRVTSFTDTTKAEIGVGTAAPTVSLSGTISYWNGSGYSTITLAPGASVAIPVAPLTITTTVNLLTLSISIRPDGQLKTGGTQLTDPDGC